MAFIDVDGTLATLELGTAPVEPQETQERAGKQFPGLSFPAALPRTREAVDELLGLLDAYRNFVVNQRHADFMAEAAKAWTRLGDEQRSLEAVGDCCHATNTAQSYADRIPTPYWSR